MKIIVLGAGSVGRVAATTLASSGMFSEIVIGDLYEEVAENVAKSLGNIGSSIKVDVLDKESLVKILKEFPLMLNCTGPFYLCGPPTLSAAIDARINYVDICDDYDATIKMLEMDSKAIENEVSALIGMGSSPGLANVLAKFAADFLFDEVESIDIYHAHGGEPSEGPAVVKHRIHSMMIDIPVFLDGEFKAVRLFEESGKMLEEETDFPGIGKYPVYAYPHPETITLPKYIDKGLKRVTNLGLVLPPEYAELIKTIVKIGMTEKEPIKVGEIHIPPIDFAVAFILKKRMELVEKAGLKEPVGSIKIVVKGIVDGKKHTYSFALSSRGQGMGEGTGIPAAIGAILMAKGSIRKKGVFPPEAAVDPLEVIALAKDILSSGGKGLPLIVEKTDESGYTEKLDIKKIFGL